MFDKNYSHFLLALDYQKDKYKVLLDPIFIKTIQSLTRAGVWTEGFVFLDELNFNICKTNQFEPLLEDTSNEDDDDDDDENTQKTNIILCCRNTTALFNIFFDIFEKNLVSIENVELQCFEKELHKHTFNDVIGHSKKLEVQGNIVVGMSSFTHITKGKTPKVYFI